MKISQNLIKKLQEGGAVADPAAQAPEQAPVQAPAQGSGNPMEIIVQTMIQALQNNDGQLALQACAAFLEFIQSQGGGAAPEAAPAEPVFAKNGGKLVVNRRLRK